jgi:integrase
VFLERVRAAGFGRLIEQYESGTMTAEAFSRAVCRQAGLERLRLHDLRHTFASFGAGSNLGLPVIGKLLGHTQASTTARYAHLADDPMRRASDMIGEQIAAAIGAPSKTSAEPGGGKAA